MSQSGNGTISGAMVFESGVTASKKLWHPTTVLKY
jgi:hypothetical protein